MHDLVADPSERTDEVHIVASRVAGSEEDFAEDEAARAEQKQHAYLALAEQLDSQIDIELLDDSLHGDSGTRHTVSPISIRHTVSPVSFSPLLTHKLLVEENSRCKNICNEFNEILF